MKNLIKRPLKIIAVAAFLLLFSCNRPTKTKNNKAEDVSEHIEATIDIDTVKIEGALFSAEGYFRVLGNRLAYMHSSLRNAYLFDAEGKLLKEVLGKGGGPSESVGDLAYHGQTSDGKNVFLDLSYAISTYTKDLSERKNREFVHWDNRKNQYSTNNLTDVNMYDFQYEDQPFFDTQWLPVTAEGKVIIPVTIAPHINTRVNCFHNESVYYAKSHTVGVLDLSTGLLEKVFAFHDPVYTLHKWLYFYDYAYRDIAKNTIYVGNRASHNIEKYNATTFEKMDDFGSKGKRFIDNDYITFTSVDDFNNADPYAVLKHSFYGHIYADDESDIVFRSYHISGLEQWGLQAYRNEKLILDTLVPFRFNVIGKIGEYYYADGIRDEENELFAAYRFKFSK